GVELEQCGNVVTYLAEMGKDILRIGDLKTDRSSRINVGETVYKVTDKKLCEEALKQVNARKTKADMVFTGNIGECAELQFMVDGKIFVARSENPIEMAMKKPADPERIKEQLSRLGDTPFEAGKVHIRADENAMIPVSLINSLRRQTADMALSGRQWSREEVAQDIIAKAIKETADTGAEKDFDDLTFAEGKVLVPLEVFMEKSTKKDDKKPQEKLEEIPYILNVTKGNLDAYIEEYFDEIKGTVKHCGIVIGNLGWIREFQKAGVKTYGDYGLNVYNRQAVKAFAEKGVDVLEWSDELSTRICRREPECMQWPSLMITEHPLDSDYLIDRKGVKHDVMKWYSGDKFLIF
ncbi:MAG: DUF3656 domain-containing protein, partial [Bacillota bacterium]|nr:DUF3656 domain-containing protein [Bacillota bacterium]